MVSYMKALLIIEGTFLIIDNQCFVEKEIPYL
jgi:hypothetical protein